METPIHNTFMIERSFPVPPAKVFQAFSDPAKKRRWYATSDHQTTETFEMDFRVGGVERAAYRMNDKTPFPGVELANDGAYYDIEPDQRIVVASGMTLGGRRISVSMLTFEFLPSGEGTKLVCTHQGVFFEGADGPEMRKGGWQALFDKLGQDLSPA